MSRWPSAEDMQARILDTADRLFYRKGIRGVGVDTVAAEIGISKRTLYNHFPSKDALVVAYLSRRLVTPGISDAPPLEQILDAFGRLERAAGTDRFRGCPFVNAISEMGDSVDGARALAISFKEGRRLWFRELLSVLRIAEADALASQLAVLLDGAIAGILVRGDASMARAARAAAATLIAAAMPKRKRRDA